jgi:hypothetical protein
MSTHCSECARHWSAYYAATVEETLAQEKLAAAKLRKINAKLIAALSARVKTLSLVGDQITLQRVDSSCSAGSRRSRETYGLRALLGLASGSLSGSL